MCPSLNMKVNLWPCVQADLPKKKDGYAALEPR